VYRSFDRFDHSGTYVTIAAVPIRLSRSPLAAALAAIFVAASRLAAAHPAPFSYVDVRVEGAALEMTLVAHMYDLAHDLGVEPADRILDAGTLHMQQQALAVLLSDRVRLTVDGVALPPQSWTGAEALPDRQAVRFRSRYDLHGAPATITVAGVAFPYDRQHQTFVNFYENTALTSQAILSDTASTYDYFTGTRQGALAVVRKFLPAGIHHILVGPDHLLFLIGLLLLGGSLRQLLLVVSAFTAAHSVTLSLAALNLFSPPARVIEPAIALSIVYVGADNLMVRGGRDMRAWIAFAFGFIHGFGFANVLREMALPAGSIGWSLLSFNIGVELGQLMVVIAVASMLTALRARSEWAGRQLALAGSAVVIAAGAFWFVERVFFPGGMA
jgi:hydrogenase/urease accessory protein HupE